VTVANLWPVDCKVNTLSTVVNFLLVVKDKAKNLLVEVLALSHVSVSLLAFLDSDKCHLLFAYFLVLRC